jgi:hypothetical protein
MTLKQIVSPIRRPQVALSILTFSLVGAFILTNANPAYLRARLGIAAKTPNQPMVVAPANKEATLQSGELAETNTVVVPRMTAPSGSRNTVALKK